MLSGGKFQICYHWFRMISVEIMSWTHVMPRRAGTKSSIKNVLLKIIWEKKEFGTEFTLSQCWKFSVRNFGWTCFLFSFSLQTSRGRWRRPRTTPLSLWPVSPTWSTHSPTMCCKCSTSRRRSSAVWSHPSITSRRLIHRPSAGLY